MIIIMKPKTAEESIDSLVDELEGRGMQVQRNSGVDCTVLGVIGDVASLDPNDFLMRDGVERVMSVSEPFKKANRKFHPEDSVIDCGGVKIGGRKLALVAGPCSVESIDQVTGIALAVRASGASMLRGGAFKPRTSPYAFQGLKLEGLSMLEEASRESGLPIVTEIMSPALVEEFDRRVDVIQVGARNMQNFDLLRELGKTRKPILLKRGLSATIEEWLMSAEYIMAAGNPNVILCERGIRTFETYTRNTLDLSAVLAVKQLSHLPVLVDPSHATGKAWMVERLSLAAVAAGADGLIIEVHNDPARALCDGAQSLTPPQFAQLVAKIHAMAPIVERTL
ncbi:3-deoxy-7-phosphoheptulonate synthase [Beduinella massiliensis]|uniref:3-deoxy-7-phosphoheptulonate synthase n=1 Tax=Beduinella massiliensis TaxID=1852363 RepID=UPI000C836EE3